jgi:DNA-binding beta-propeller fold protein YncE
MRVTSFVCLAVLTAACGGGGDSNKIKIVDSGSFVGCLSSNECPPGYVCNDFGQCESGGGGVSGDGGMPPPETEYEYGAPISSQRYVYVPMTEQDELVRIDGNTLAVRSTAVGDQPRVVATIPGTDGALVLDSTNGTATIVRPQGETDSTKVVGTLQRLNRVDVDPTGRFAVVWFDLAKVIADGGTGGTGSFQDVTIIRLAAGNEKAVNLTVGFRPREVQFDATGNRAYVITEDGVSVVDLTYATSHAPSIVPPIRVIDPSVPPSDVEVDIVATGEWAAVRQAGVASLRVVNVGTTPGVAYTLSLASPPTDIDLAPDGSRVFAVSRDAAKLAVIDVPGDALSPSGIETIDLAGAAVGSLVLSPDGKRGLLYTNATADERITLLALDQAGYPRQTWTLKKSVRAVAISPTSTTALVIHAKAFGDPGTATSFDEYLDRSYGYTLLDLASGFGKVQVTPVDPGAFAYAPDGNKLYVALDGGDAPTATRELQIVAVQTGVVVSKQLGSPPSAVGFLPGVAQAFTAQRHPLGRVSFVAHGSDAMRTITGFDLNNNVVH